MRRRCISASVVTKSNLSESVHDRHSHSHTRMCIRVLGQTHPLLARRSDPVVLAPRLPTSLSISVPASVSLSLNIPVSQYLSISVSGCLCVSVSLSLRLSGSHSVPHSLSISVRTARATRVHGPWRESGDFSSGSANAACSTSYVTARITHIDTSTHAHT